MGRPGWAIHSAAFPLEGSSLRVRSTGLSLRSAAVFLGALATFFLLRLPSLIEPAWYADEGTYVLSLPD